MPTKNMQQIKIMQHKKTHPTTIPAIMPALLSEDDEHVLVVPKQSLPFQVHPE